MFQSCNSCFLLFRQSIDIYVIAASVTTAAAVLGGLKAIGTAFSLPAAVAMQPPAPTVYRRLSNGAFARLRFFSQLTVMALRHRTYPVHGVQFHPESIMTREGQHLLHNFLNV